MAPKRRNSDSSDEDDIKRTSTSDGRVRIGPASTAKGEARKRTERACVNCRTRRSKCDGHQPCATCMRADKDCTFPQPQKRASMKEINAYREQNAILQAELARQQAQVNGPQPMMHASTSRAWYPPPGASHMTPPLHSPAVHPPSYGHAPVYAQAPYAHDYHSSMPPIPPRSTSAPNFAPPSNHSPHIRAVPISNARIRADVALFLDPVHDRNRSEERMLASGVRQVNNGLDLLTEASEVTQANTPRESSDAPPPASKQHAPVEQRSGHGTPTNGANPEVSTEEGLDMFTLLPQEEAFELLEWHERYIQGILPKLDFDLFVAQVRHTYTQGADPRSLDRLWLATLNMSLAASAQIRLSIEGNQDSVLPEKLFRRAQRLAPMSMLVRCNPELQVAQYLILVSELAMSSSNAQLCGAALSLATSICRRLRLHMPAPASMSVTEKQLRSTVWASCIALEATSGAMLATPTAIFPHETVDALLPVELAPIPGEPIARIAFFAHAVKLFRLWLEILSELYERDTKSDPIQSVTAAIRLDSTIDEWYATIPIPLRRESEAIQAGHWQWLAMQSNILQARFWWSKVLLYRPMLFRIVQYALADPAAQPSAYNSLKLRGGSAGTEMVAMLARRATEAAVSLVMWLASVKEAHMRGAWWHVTCYLYSSSLIMLAAQVVVIRRPDLAELAPASCDEALDRVLELLQASFDRAVATAEDNQPLSPVARTAKQCYERLSKMRSVIQRAAAANTPATSTNTPSNEMPAVVSDPVLAQLLNLLPSQRHPYGADRSGAFAALAATNINGPVSAGPASPQRTDWLTTGGDSLWATGDLRGHQQAGIPSALDEAWSAQLLSSQGLDSLWQSSEFAMDPLVMDGNGEAGEASLRNL